MVKKLNQACVLTINGGSSSIKFALYQTGDLQKRRLYGKVDRIGLSGTNLTFHDPTGKAHGATLATRNVSDFRQTGIELINPWKGED